MQVDNICKCGNRFSTHEDGSCFVCIERKVLSCGMCNHKPYWGVLHNNNTHATQCRSYIVPTKLDKGTIEKSIQKVVDKLNKSREKKESISISDHYKLRQFDVKNAFDDILKGEINSNKTKSDLEKDIAMILLDYKENDLGTLSTAKRIVELINKDK